MPFDYVLYEMSWVNMVMYGAVTPSYKSPDKDGKKKHEHISGDDPRNQERIDKELEALG